MSTIKIKCDANWTLRHIDPFEFNEKRYKNWMAVVTKNENGELNYNFLKVKWGGSGKFIDIKTLKVGDILCVGIRDNRKYRGAGKAFYKVIERKEDRLIMTWETTYRKAESPNSIVV